MMQCWSKDPDDRLIFKEISNKLSKGAGSDEDMQNSKPYYLENVNVD